MSSTRIRDSSCAGGCELTVGTVGPLLGRWWASSPNAMAKLPRVEGGKKEKVSGVSNHRGNGWQTADGKRSVHGKSTRFTLDQPSRNKPTSRPESEWGPLHSKAQHSTHQNPQDVQRYYTVGKSHITTHANLTYFSPYVLSRRPARCCYSPETSSGCLHKFAQCSHFRTACFL